MPDGLKRVLTGKDVVALAFGAVVGWGWVVLSGEWLQTGGTLGAILAFLLGGTVMLFVGQTYAELTPALPQCGGEHVFSLRAMGRTGSFICTWSLILSYVGVCAFEACALPSVVEYILPNFLQGYLYTIGGFDLYLTWVLVGVVSAVILTCVNYIGIEPVAKLQRWLTVVIAAVGILLIVAALFQGETANLSPALPHGVSGMLSVTVMTPFMLVGFDVIPQAAEEINIPFRKIGVLILFSIALAVIWYIAIIFSVSLMLTGEELAGSTLATADAMKKAFGGKQMAAVVLIIGGMAGILSSWNAFFVGGSRTIYAMANSGMIPACFGKLHPKYRTPCNAVLLMGLFCAVAPFFGKKTMSCLANAGSFSTVLAYFMVVLSFILLRKKEPDL
ncbi:MAG: APC family permease, partial [Oscillospiraceae bacterium]